MSDFKHLLEPTCICHGAAIYNCPKFKYQQPYFSIVLFSPYPQRAPVDPDGKRINPEGCLESDNRLLLDYVGGEK